MYERGEQKQQGEPRGEHDGDVKPTVRARTSRMRSTPGPRGCAAWGPLAPGGVDSLRAGRRPGGETPALAGLPGIARGRGLVEPPSESPWSWRESSAAEGPPCVGDGSPPWWWTP